MRFHWMKRFGWDGGLPDLIKMAKTLDEHGVYSVLLPYGATDMDYFLAIPDMVHNSNNLKFMMAVRPYAVSPEYLARTFKSLVYSFGSRATLNVVPGSLFPEEEKFVFKNYLGDISQIEDGPKRAELSEIWTEKFLDIMEDLKPEMYTIANSLRTVEIANKYFDYGITSPHRMEHNVDNLKSKIVLVMDPLIENPGDAEVEYLDRVFGLEKEKAHVEPKHLRHFVSGTTEEVYQQIKDISEKYGVEDFMIRTDQKDISNILNLVKQMTEDFK